MCGPEPVAHRKRRWRRPLAALCVTIPGLLACQTDDTPLHREISARPAAAEDQAWRVRGAPADGPDRFGFGRPSTLEEVEAWDIDVRPDGTGLPPGSGSVEWGGELYQRKCASCHGRTGIEGPDYPLVGRVPGDAFPFGAQLGIRRTIGSYWPYATTLFDYIRRTMPFTSPGSLSADEVYGVTAYLLFMNEIVPVDTVLDAESLPTIRMPARDRFVPDDRRGGPEVR